MPWFTSSAGAFAGGILTALVGAALAAPAVAQQKAATPDFSSNQVGWNGPAAISFAPVPGRVPPVTSDPAHPFVRNGAGRQPTYRIADLTNPNLKPWVKEHMKKDNDEVLAGKIAFTARSSCMPAGVPGFIAFGGANPVYFIQTPKQVWMIYSGDQQVRRIYLDVPHSANPKPSWYGESVGHYEGDTLVIDTIGQDARTVVDPYRTPHTEKLHVVERWRIVEDGQAMDVTFTVEDPDTFNEPWSGTRRYLRVQQPMLEEVCAETISTCSTITSRSRTSRISERMLRPRSLASIVGWAKPTGPAFGRPDDRLRVPTAAASGGHGAQVRAFAHLTSHLMEVHSKECKMRSIPLTICVAAIAACAAATAQCEEKIHELRASPTTVHRGFFDASLKPVLTIDSGDVVRLWTTTGNPRYFESLGVPKEKIPAELYAAFEGAPGDGRDDHTLDGPIAVRGAEPGDTVEIKIRAIDLWLPIAAMGFRANRGSLPEDFPYSRDRVFFIDPAKKVIEFAPSIVVPAKPFWGVIGVAPPRSMGRVPSGPPNVFGGNLDNHDLQPGTSLFLPVHASGALISIGDGHAVQGDGEVGMSAVETSLRGEIQIVLHKGMRIGWPRAETPTHYMTMGLHEDLNMAAKIATREMINFVVETKGVTRDDALMLLSAAMDLHVTEIVDITKGVHAMLPKAIFQK